MNEFIDTLSPKEIFYLENIELLMKAPDTTFGKNASNLKEKFLLDAISKQHKQIF